MAVNQGLKSLAGSSPEFSNQHVQNLINNAETSFAVNQRTLHKTIDDSVVLTESQRNTVLESLNVQPHLNFGRLFHDLDVHSLNLINGSLGEPRTGGDASTFLDQMQSVQSFVTVIPLVLGHTADAINKGVTGHFGTVNGSINANMEDIAKNILLIDSLSAGDSDLLIKGTAIITAINNLQSFMNSLDGSTAFDQSTFDTRRTAYETAANNMNTKLAGGQFVDILASFKTNTTAVRDQINLEVTNLGSIDTFEKSLSETSQFQTLAGDSEMRNLITQTSTNANFIDYFNNYSTRFNNSHPIFSDVSDSSIEDKENEILKLKNLPDVTNSEDFDSVAEKATRDSRLKTRLETTNKTSEDIIRKAAELLAIRDLNRSLFAISKSLLENMNEHDKAEIKTQIEQSQNIETLS